MASTNRKSVGNDKFKRTLLFSFVGLSLLLIGLIVGEGLAGDAPDTPSYYRDSFEIDPSTYVTLTAEALEFELQWDGTPRPTAVPNENEHGAGGGSGQGGGHGQNEPQQTPTPTGIQTP